MKKKKNKKNKNEMKDELKKITNENLLFTYAKRM